MPKKGRDPLKLPTRLQTALEALYGHYEKTFILLGREGHSGAALLHHRLPKHRHLEAGLMTSKTVAWPSSEISMKPRGIRLRVRTRC